MSDRIEHDINMVAKVIQQIFPTKDIKNKIAKTTRIGRSNPESSSARPLRTVFSDTRTKFEVLTSSDKLNDSKDENLKQIRISVDRTQFELDQRKMPKEELERRIMDGETNLVTIRGEIIKKDIIANANTERGIVTLTESQLNKRNYKNPKQPLAGARTN